MVTPVAKREVAGMDDGTPGEPSNPRERSAGCQAVRRSGLMVPIRPIAAAGCVQALRS